MEIVEIARIFGERKRGGRGEAIQSPFEVESMKMTANKEWKNYEVVVQTLIDKLVSVKTELHLERIERKQKIKGTSDTEWEIDVLAYDSTNGKPVLVECKYWDKKVPRDIVTSFVYKIRDVGGDRGIIVTTVGLQKGAREIADAENIQVILLERGSTADEFDLSLPKQGQHHVGRHGVVKLKDKVKMVILSLRKKNSG